MDAIAHERLPQAAAGQPSNIALTTEFDGLTSGASFDAPRKSWQLAAGHPTRVHDTGDEVVPLHSVLVRTAIGELGKAGTGRPLQIVG